MTTKPENDKLVGEYVTARAKFNRLHMVRRLPLHTDNPENLCHNIKLK